MKRTFTAFALAALLCGCGTPLPHIGTTIFDGNGAAP